MSKQQKAEEETLFTSSYSDIAKRMSPKLIVMSSFYIEAGMVMLVIAYILNETYNAASMFCLVAGMVLVLFGLYKLFCRSKRDVYLPTGSEIKRNVLFFDSKQLVLLREYINTGEFPSNTSIQCVSNGCIKMEILETADGRFAGAQLFEFVPYVYNPVTSVHYYKDEQAGLLSEFVKSIKSKSA